VDQLEAALELLHRAAGVRQEELTGLGRVRPLADALEQRQTDLLFQLADLHAHSRLREPELARRPGEAPVARDGGERLQVRELDVHFGGIKKYLIVMIKTIDFTDTQNLGIMPRMDSSFYVLEVLAKDRLDRARLDAGRRRLLRRAEVLSIASRG
jgi:hypothetical protein